MKTKIRFLCSIFLSGWLSDPISAAPALAIPVETVLNRDTAQSTHDGHTFVAPSGWSIHTRAPVVIATVPERGSYVALVDVSAPDAETAVAAAWAAYKPDASLTLRRAADMPLRQGWQFVRGFRYESATSDERIVSAVARKSGKRWNIAIMDMALKIAEMRDAQIELLLGSLTPKGYIPENFAGKVALRLDTKRVTQLEQFVENTRQMFAVPGVAIGVIQNGKVLLAKGFGVRKLGEQKKVDAETLFMIASNTKALTTLMLAKLVDAGRFTWETPVTQVMPTFRLGNAQTTRSILMKHLVCACTGLPRQDMETVFEGERLQPASVLPLVASMQPTSALGELYQYSNLMAGAAGYIGGHMQHPGMEPGAAYDAAMQSLVFNPLAMRSTTFDFDKAQRGNYASPHAPNIDGQTVVASMDSNRSARMSRPDGGAWSNVNDLLRYVQMEIDQGHQASGKRYISAAPLLARRAQQISRGSDLGYGMGLKIDRTTGTTMIHHGGTTTGYISDMLWLPEHKVGAVILTNAQGGTSLRNLFRRRLLELLFDANPEAIANAAIFQKSITDDAAAQRKSLTIPAAAAATQQLASRYRSVELGEIRVEKKGGSIWFDFGGWKSEMASRQEQGAATWLVTIAPGEIGYEFRVKNSKRSQSLVLNDGQRDYVFYAAP